LAAANESSQAQVLLQEAITMSQNRAADLPKINGVAGNGRIIAASMAIAAHNLGAIFNSTKLFGNTVLPPPAGLFTRCISDMIKCIKDADNKQVQYRKRLSQIKTAAYIWRHAVFFASKVEENCELRKNVDDSLKLAAGCARAVNLLSLACPVWFDDAEMSSEGIFLGWGDL
jgi:hypothetical protein